MMNYIYNTKIYRIDIDTVHADLSKMGLKEYSKKDILNITNRINSLYLREKSEILYLILFLYKKLLDKESDYIEGKKVNFKFEFLKKKSRINIYLDNKYISLFMPFSILEKDEEFIIQSRMDSNLVIEANTLNILLKYFEKNIFMNYTSYHLLDQVEKLEEIYAEFLKEDITILPFEDISKLCSELLYFDSSYLRFDIDLENSLRLDVSDQIIKERIYAHPPYHFDSDYRDAPSYKIGVDKCLNILDFSSLFQLKDMDKSFMIHNNYTPKHLIGEVQKYKDSLDFSNKMVLDKYKHN
ncbi:hypothetical protein [Lactococcus lactis]|uniref:hypothetical protein n=1 Tax=Lactococcus lactis TaxID=1358 RepID=UPI0020745CB6|nr:hypothetical protein [Lactococcus lactis]